MSLPLEQCPIPADYEELAKAYKDLAKLHDRSLRRHAQELQFYKDKLRLLAAKIFGAKADGVVVSLFDEAELSAEVEPDDSENTSSSEPEAKGNGKPKKNKRKTIPDHLPRNRIEHDLDEDQKTCPIDGTRLVRMGEDVREEIDFIPAKIIVNQHAYLKYSCPCCTSGVHTAETIKRAIPGSVASPALIAQIATQKYLDHLPIHRQAQIFERSGLLITRATMCSWMIKLGELLLPITNIMFDDLLTSKALQCDETPLRVLKIDGVVTSKKSYIWTVARWGPGHKIIYYEFDRTRSGKVPCRLFPDFEGSLQVDGYKGYDRLFATYPRIKRIGCMAHVRRGFADLLKTLKKVHRSRHPANKIIKVIRELYDIEDQLRGQDPEQRQTIRMSDATAIFDSLQELVTTESLAVAGSSLYGEALAYAAKELVNIRRYLNDGHAELDNNLIENAIRPFCLGRRNWLFADTESGAQASATIYTVLQTAKANGREPASYLAMLIERLPYCNDLADFEALLPYTRVN